MRGRWKGEREEGERERGEVRGRWKGEREEGERERGGEGREREEGERERGGEGEGRGRGGGEGMGWERREDGREKREGIGERREGDGREKRGWEREEGMGERGDGRVKGGGERESVLDREMVCKLLPSKLDPWISFTKYGFLVSTQFFPVPLERGTMGDLVGCGQRNVNNMTLLPYMEPPSQLARTLEVKYLKVFKCLRRQLN